jgi:hypothetical protein
MNASKAFLVNNAGGSGGSGGAFIFRPSAPTSSGDVYNNWPLLMAAVLATEGPQEIWVDESGLAEAAIPIDFQNRISLACRNGNVATVLDFGGGVLGDQSVLNLRDVYGSLTLRSRNTAIPVLASSSGNQLVFHDGGSFTTDVGKQPFYSAITAGSRDIYFNGRSNTIAASSAGDPTVLCQGGCDVRVRLQGVKGTITPYAVAFGDANPASRFRMFEYGNPNGLISIAMPTAVAGQLNYPRFMPETFNFGANLTVVNDYAVVNGAAADGAVNAALLPDSDVEAICGTENQMRQFVWNSDGADATTVFEVLVNGLVVFTTAGGAITGVRGAITMLPFGAGPAFATLFNVLGNRIAVRYVGGTVPGRTTLRIQ